MFSRAWYLLFSLASQRFVKDGNSALTGLEECSGIFSMEAARAVWNWQYSRYSRQDMDVRMRKGLRNLTCRKGGSLMNGSLFLFDDDHGRVR